MFLLDYNQQQNETYRYYIKGATLPMTYKKILQQAITISEKFLQLYLNNSKQTSLYNHVDDFIQGLKQQEEKNFLSKTIDTSSSLDIILKSELIIYMNNAWQAVEAPPSSSPDLKITLEHIWSSILHKLLIHSFHDEEFKDSLQSWEVITYKFPEDKALNQFIKQNESESMAPPIDAIYSTRPSNYSCLITYPKTLFSHLMKSNQQPLNSGSLNIDQNVAKKLLTYS